MINYLAIAQELFPNVVDAQHSQDHAAIELTFEDGSKKLIPYRAFGVHDAD